MEMIECKEHIKIEDGSHEGVIVRVERRTTPFDYTDLIISMNEGKTELKAGFPTYITPESHMGKLLTRMGTTLVIGTMYDPEALLKGKKVFFMTLTDKKSDGREFAEVIRESIKPSTQKTVEAK
jgi:hypothetical protein